MINAFLRFLGFYDSYGLKHSTDHLDKMKYDVSMMPIYDAAKYADAITVKMVHRKDSDLRKQIMEFPDNPSDDFFRNWNATTCGNLAYIGFYGQTPIKEKAIKMFLAYRKYCAKRM